VCNLCETTIKHESAWQSHLHTTQHNLRQTRAQDVENTRHSDTGKRKRSASGSASPPAESRKKIRPATAGSPGDAEAQKSTESETSIVGPPEATTDGAFHEVSELDQANTNGKPRTQDLDDFERELAELEASVPVQTAAYEDATISSAPLSAAELAAQAREEHSAQRGKRDLEIADEREDAAQLLADEFEEMEGLELRAQKLRARREALRAVEANANRNRSEDADADADSGTNMPDPIRSAVQEKPDIQQDDNDNGKKDGSRGDDGDDDGGDVDDDDDDDDGDDDGDAYWTFGGR
jgi:hypothetical protein